MRKLKGFTGIELAVVMVAIAVIGYFSVPPTIKAFGTLASGGDKNQTKITHKVKQQYQMFYQDKKGKFIPAPTPYKLEIEDTNYDSQAPKATLWEKIQRYVFLIGALCLIFPAFGVWLYKRFRDMKTNFTQLVTGIEEAKKTMTPEAVASLETNLSKKMDTSAKKEVKQIKVKL